MRRKAATGCIPVIVPYAHLPPVDARGIAGIGKGEMVTRVEPAMIGGAEAVESTKFDHRMSPVGVVSAVQIGLEGVQENCNKFAHDVQVIRTMKLGEPTLDQLRLFLAVEEGGSLDRKSTRLNSSH